MAKGKSKQQKTKKKKVSPIERKKMINNLFKKDNKRDNNKPQAANKFEAKVKKSEPKKKIKQFKRKKSEGNYTRDKVAELDKKLTEIRHKINQT